MVDFVLFRFMYHYILIYIKKYELNYFVVNNYIFNFNKFRVKISYKISLKFFLLETNCKATLGHTFHNKVTRDTILKTLDIYTYNKDNSQRILLF